ncbi:MAG: transglutaminase domain-containing protein [Parvibaculales bacterium]
MTKSKCFFALIAATIGFFNLIPSASANPLPPETLKAAREYFQQQQIDPAWLRQLSPSNTAAYLNKSVYAHCVNGSISVPLDTLFQDCEATCFGYAHVLRGLLEALGYQTRFVHLHNIPNQGNHTALEIKINGKWRFLDPTFGAYFTTDGTPDGDLLSLQEVIRHDLASLQTKVVATQKTRPLSNQSINTLYGAPFLHPYMRLVNYLVAEQISYGDQSEYLNLDIPIQLKNGYGSFGLKQPAPLQELEKGWLNITNQSLRDEDLLNDVSYNSSFLSLSPTTRITTLSLSGLTPGKPHKLRVLFYNYYDGGEIEILQIGKSVKNLMIEPVTLGKGTHFYEGAFIPHRSNAVYLIRQKKENRLSRLFGVTVEEQ